MSFECFSLQPRQVTGQFPMETRHLSYFNRKLGKTGNGFQSLTIRISPGVFGAIFYLTGSWKGIYKPYTSL